MKIKTEILQGLKLGVKFREKGKKIESEMDKLLLRGGYMVEGGAKRVVRVLTGRLRASISTRLAENRSEVGTNVEYARKIEKIYPFLMTSLKAKEEGIRKMFRTEVAKIIRG